MSSFGEVHRVLEQLEEYHSKLNSNSQNVELKIAIEKIISMFKTSLIQTLLDINEFYNDTLINTRKSHLQKIDEAKRMAERWSPSFPSSSNNNNSLNSLSNEWHTEQIVFEKGQIGLGLSITGGLDQPIAPNDTFIYVTNITPGGAVAKDGRMKIFDIILKVNNIDTTAVPHNVAVQALKDSGNIVKLYLKRPVNKKKMFNSYYNNTYLNGVTKKTVSESLERLPGVRRIELYKTSSGLGFSIAGGVGNEHVPGDNGIYITKVIEGGAAYTDGRIGVGDKIICVDETSLQNVTHEFAVQTLKSTGNKVSLLYYNQNSLSNESFLQEGCDFGYQFPTQPRTITLVKGNQGLGFNIVGGENGEPIFVSYVLPGGVADQSGNVRKGDVLLKVNGIPLDYASHTDAAGTLKNATNPVTLTLQYREDDFKAFEKKIDQLRNEMINGFLDEEDNIYVKALFDNTSASQSSHRSIKFQYGDILHIVNSNDDDWWTAEKVNTFGERISEKGFIPSKRKVEKREKQKRKQFNIKQMNRSLGGTKRNVIEHNKLKYWEEAKLHREDYTGTDFTTTDDGSDSEDYNNEIIYSYEPVEIIQINYVRPVIILGVLKDRINDELIRRQPYRFAPCIPHTSRLPRDNEVNGKDYYFVSKSQMEYDVQNNVFIEAGQFQNNLYGTSISSVIDVANEGKHCILDVSGNAIRRLQTQANIQPIAILIKPRNHQQLMEWDSSLSEEDAKVMYSRALRIEKNFKDLFTSIVCGSTFEEILHNIIEVINNNSQSHAWIRSRNIKL
uniref:Disks large homolog 1 n=1 Tax=Parastrongyloides trichosuri TaxID=131310 RepID=A0A0N4ZJA6_PARTI